MKRILKVVLLVTLFLCVGFVNTNGQNKRAKDKPPITPKWALGHIVWEDSVNTQSTIIYLVEKYKEEDIPVSGIIIDSPWSLSYNDFNWDKSKYPKPNEMIQNFKSANIKVILWLTGCINSVSKDVPMQKSPDFDYVRKKKYAINNGKESHWWKGEGVHLDFTNKEAVNWWSKKLDKVFVDGVCGWKVDQGEQTFGDITGSVITSVGKMSLRDFKFFYYDSMFDYATSRKDEGIILARPFSHQGGMASRISKVSIGWSGDFSGDWSGIKLQLNNIYTSAQAGYGALACEIGGFQHKHSTKAELLRYVQFASMCATMINGGANGALTNHLPWYHDNEVTDIYRYFVNLHYELRGYIFSGLVDAYQNGGSVLKDVSFEEESHKLGNNIFFKAITSDTNIVTFKLPEDGEWIDFWTDEKYEGGTKITKEYKLDKAPIFIRAGAIIPLEISNNLTSIGDETFAGKTTLLIYPNGKSHYLYHKPIGDGIEYKDIEIIYKEGKISVKAQDEYNFIFLIKGETNELSKLEKKGKEFEIIIH